MDNSLKNNRLRLFVGRNQAQFRTGIPAPAREYGPWIGFKQVRTGHRGTGLLSGNIDSTFLISSLYRRLSNAI